MKKLALVVIVVVACAIPREARADTLAFDGLGKSSVVTLDGIISGTFYAGELNWEWLGAVPAGFTRSFFTYCIDLLNDAVSPQDAVVRSTDDYASANVADAGAKAAWLFNTFAPVIRASGTDLQAAGLQVAIWEAIYDPTLDLTTGDFRLVTDPWIYGGQQNALAIYDQAKQYLKDLSGASYAGSSAVWLDAPVPGQDQITRVPEPAALTLLGLGALAAAKASRGRRRRPGV